MAYSYAMDSASIANLYSENVMMKKKQTDYVKNASGYGAI